MNEIVIRVPNHLGDCLMAYPAISAMASAAGDTRITLLLPQWAEPIYARMKNISLLPLDSGKLHGPGAIIFQSRILRKMKFDSGIILTPSFSSALILLLAGVRKRYGYRGEGRGMLLNHPVPKPDGIMHRARSYMRLIEHFTQNPLPDSIPQMEISPSAHSAAITLLRENGIDESGQFVAIAPQAVAESRRWGSDNYAALAQTILSSSGGRLILVGTDSERAAGAQIAGDDKRIVNLCGRTDIGSAAALLKKACLFIGNDSGLAHLAAAIGIPLVILSGADNPAETSPLSEKKTVIIKDNLDCISCVKNVCPRPGDDFMRCMRDISVDQVFDAAQKFLTAEQP
ncbi:MAG: lipopolysaccharide heptosyltransferase II [candidate division Zixibacteria bacterium]|nr:lipopolysaccharide heptosyltransferase II [candidate division Zixibacteria bacterium]